MLKKLLILSVFLLSACSENKNSIIELIEKKASTPEIVLAIEQSTDVNARSKKLKQTPLIAASLSGNSVVVSALLKAGAM